MSNQNTQANNKRLAKNTIILYMRTLFTMFVSLYTSRVVLANLGIDDYGIYNVVGGFVGMLSILSGSLSTAISRFITYELGKGDVSKLNKIFCTSINIQVVMAFVIILIGEILGVWFLNTYLNIPSERMEAANFIFHCSLLVFAFNLLYVPYNACIIAHEKMQAFAYMSIYDAVAKLLIAYCIGITPWDKLDTYAAMLLLVSISSTLIYMIYCRRKFVECRYHFVHDSSLLRSMSGFAGWTFFTGGAAVFNTQGLNILINVFFGVSLNAARGIASQIEGIILRFVNDFTTAINPQITKSYASEDYGSMNVLICRGAKFSFFLLLFFALPVLFETDILLRLWLGNYPGSAANFFRLTMIGTMVNILGNTGYTACMATGNIRKYVLVITSVGFLVFPLTWVAYLLGAPAEACYIIYVLVYFAIVFVRLSIMRELLNFPASMFLKDVLFKVGIVSIVAIIGPCVVAIFIPESITRFIINGCVCVVSTLLSIYVFGLSQPEKNLINGKINIIRNKRCR